MKIHNFLRQGDLIFRRDKIPNTAVPTTDRIVELGEFTNHKHKLVGNAQIYLVKEQNIILDKYIKVEQQAELVHEEHNTIPMFEGEWKLVHEQEYDPFQEAIIRVRD